jgi:phosphopantothenoylcysteine decarboxylase/phosphopantothenate--cysteine ligase
MKKSKQQPRKKAASGSLESSSPPPPPPPAPGLRDLEGRRVLLGVSSSIAEHRALDLASALVKRGALVQVVMTEEATRLIQPLAFEAITRRRVVVSLWERPHAYEMEHLEWTKWAEVFLVAPATANVIAKLALGIADDALTTFALAWRGRLLLAPAMNPAMFSHPALNDNLQRLRERGVGCIGPAVGATACGDVGLGRLAPVENILTRVVEALGAAPQGAPRGESSLAGLRVLVTSGPTREYLDPVRYLSNPSSGKMGHALAAEAARRGARVTLLHGPVALPTPEGLEEAVAITTAREMFEEAVKRAPEMDLFIFAAAVSDWRPA